MSTDFEGSRREFFEILAEFDAPAYVRRAQSVEQSWSEFKNRCLRERLELLAMPTTRLGMLAALIDHDWQKVGKYLSSSADADYLKCLFEQWQPELRVRLAATDSPRKIAGAIQQLLASMNRFNGKWKEHVAELDLSSVNRVRQGYNDYYVVEKACAFASERIGRIGFSLLPMLSTEDVMAEFPCLHVPAMR